MTARRRSASKMTGLGPPEGQQWVWMTSSMMSSMSFRALGINARRILDFLLTEHAAHGGQENGNLAATYRQLAQWGVTKDDVRKGLEELYVTGFVEMTRQGARQGDGGQECSRYALTWLPTFVGTPEAMPPSNAWLRVADFLRRSGITDLRSIRTWLKGQVASKARRTTPPKKQNVTPHLRLVPPLICDRRDIV